jgi:hypothetical protein
MKKIYYLLALLPLAFTACQKQPLVTPTTPLVKSTKEALSFTLAPADYQLLPNSVYAYSTFSFNSTTDADNYIATILGIKESAGVADGSTATVGYSLATPTLKVADSLYKDVTLTVGASEYKPITGNTYGDFTAANVLAYLAAKFPTPVANQLVVLTYVLYTTADNTVTNSFLYLNGAWKLIYQITPAQYTEVGDGKYDEFVAADLPKLTGYFNFFLKNDITIADTAKAGDIEYVSYNYYTSAADDQKVLALTYDGNNWSQNTRAATASFVRSNGVWAAVLPLPTISHTLTSADISLIANSTTTGASSTLLTDLGKYGDFNSGTSGWTTAELNAAFILVLTADYPTPALKTNYVITYLYYINSADVPTQAAFQWSGTAWIPQQ